MNAPLMPSGLFKRFRITVFLLVTASMADAIELQLFKLLLHIHINVL